MGEAVISHLLDRFEDRRPPPTLLETWDSSLTSFLDPDPFLLRPSEAGMGQNLDRLLGGGFTVGQMASVVSLGAGVGKTSFLHQLADGVALESGRRYVTGLERDVVPVVTPVILVSEMTTRDLTLRSLARQAGVEGYLLRDPRGEHGRRPLREGLTEGEAALQKANKAASGFHDGAWFLTPMDRTVQIQVSALHEAVDRIREYWTALHAKVPAVLVVVDPIHRLLDPTRPEVEGIGEALQGMLDLAQRTEAIVLLSSDTTKEAAASRKDVGSLDRGEKLARSAELAFRGNYQLLHMPDVALGIVTLRDDDEHLSDEDRARLRHQPSGTIYAEVVNAKARWDMAGRRAAYFLDPAMFRFRWTDIRELQGERSLEDRILDFIEREPGCSWNRLRTRVEGGNDRIKTTLEALVDDGRVDDHGDEKTGKRLHISRNTSGDKGRTGSGQPTDNGEDRGVSGGALPKGREPPPGQPHPLAYGSRVEDTMRTDDVDGTFAARGRIEFACACSGTQLGHSRTEADSPFPCDTSGSGSAKDPDCLPTQRAAHFGGST